MIEPLFLVSACICGIACLVLSLGVYGCRVLARPGSRLRSNVTFSILLSLLTGLLPASLGALVAFGFAAEAEIAALGWTAAAALLAGAAGTLALALGVLRAAYRASRPASAPRAQVVPLAPLPPSPSPADPRRVKAAA